MSENIEQMMADAREKLNSKASPPEFVEVMNKIIESITKLDAQLDTIEKQQEEEQEDSGAIVKHYCGKQIDFPPVAWCGLEVDHGGPCEP